MKVYPAVKERYIPKRGTLFQPVTKHDGHPLDHLDQAVVEAGGVPLEEQHDGVGVVDRAEQGRHHLFH